MIQLRKFKTRSKHIRDDDFVWVNPDHISFLSCDTGAASTTVTCIGGGRTFVTETPEQILAMIPQKFGDRPANY
jgi:hypothetical protein